MNCLSLAASDASFKLISLLKQVLSNMVSKRKRPSIGDDHTPFLHNYVNKDLQSYFKFFNFFQNFIAYPKYRIKDNFIIPNGRVAHSISFLITLITLMVNLNKVAKFDVNKSYTANFSRIINTCTYLNSLVYSVGFIINFVINYRSRYGNVALVLKLQKISNVISMKSKRFRRKILCNNLFNVFMIVQYLTFNFCMFKLTDDSHKHELLSDLLVIYFDLNILYAIRVIVLLQCYTLSLIELMKTKDLSLRGKQLYCSRMFQAYGDLLDSYRIFIEVFQDLIIFFVFETFGHALGYLEITITMFRNDFTKNTFQMSADLHNSSLLLIVFLGWLEKNLLLILVLGLEMEKFYILMEKIQSKCAIWMENQNCAEVERRMFKNMRRLYHSHFSKASARGVFFIDATLHLQLTDVITTYIVVLLQFTFS